MIGKNCHMWQEGISVSRLHAESQVRKNLYVSFAVRVVKAEKNLKQRLARGGRKLGRKEKSQRQKTAPTK